MDRVELHDVEYGDCTVLVGQNRQILMVDCGSVTVNTPDAPLNGTVTSPVL